MYRRPSARKRKHQNQKLNLIPILDSVFIFIFFLLMSANFIKIFEISSDVPMISESEPPKSKEKPLALTLEIETRKIEVKTGLPSRTIKIIKKTEQGNYNLEELRNFLVQLKQKHAKDNTAILIPKINITYEELVQIMDAVRILKNTDPAIYYKDKDGIDVKVKALFDNIVFGNLIS